MCHAQWARGGVGRISRTISTAKTDARIGLLFSFFFLHFPFWAFNQWRGSGKGADNTLAGRHLMIWLTEVEGCYDHPPLLPLLH
jgi:hypothetical protein